MRRRPRGRAPTSIDVYATAKVNIGWRVGERRPDGYHEVSGALQSVSVIDRLRIRTHDDPDEVRARTVVHMDDVPVGLDVDGSEAIEDLYGEDNLVLRAAVRLAEDVLPRPTTIALTKRIPASAGLGGGSADAAAALTGLGLAWSADLDAAGLLARAAEVGSDVPAIILGGLVHASGRGERVRSIGCASGCRFVIGIADAALRTSDVYARFDELRMSGPPRCFETNDLEAAAASLHPGIEPGLAAMRDAGAPVVFVSGSGPAVVGVVPDPRDAEEIASRARRGFRSVLVADPTPWGVRLALGGRRPVAERPETTR